MNNIIEKSKQYQFNSLEYVDLEDIENAVSYIDTDQSQFLYQKSDGNKELYWDSKSKDNIQLFWAARSKEDFFEGLKQTIDHVKQIEANAEKLYMEFIPEAFLKELTGMGFQVVSEWVDFWNRDLTSLALQAAQTVDIRSLKEEEITIASDITKNCKGYSRGFTGQSEGLIREWSKNENSKLFAAEVGGSIVGICYVILYGFDSEKGTVLWIRELAVDPKYQSKGIGRALINHGINWGRENGAKRSFLACDAENHNAIKLYESLNYKRAEERGQINVELEL